MAVTIVSWCNLNCLGLKTVVVMTPIWFSAFLLIAGASNASAKPSINANPPNETEEWVTQQVMAGEIADLEKHFCDAELQKLDSKFLETLLTEDLPSPKARRTGVRIVGAIFNQPISLSNARIPFQVRLDGCEFNSTVDFAHTRFAEIVSFQWSTFKGDVTFNGTTFGIIVDFLGSRFQGDVNLAGAITISEFHANRTKFEKNAHFYGMEVRSNAIFNDAKFRQVVDFDTVKIAGALDMTDVQFEDENYTIFTRMNCAGLARFKGMTFTGSLPLRDSTFLDLEIAGVNFTPNDRLQEIDPLGWQVKPISKLDLRNVTVKRRLTIRSILIHDVAAGALHVEGPAEFTQVHVTNASDFGFSVFSTLSMWNCSWPKNAHFQGVSYKYIGAAPTEPESHANLLKLANQSAYAADLYSNLEHFFWQEGNRAEADGVFVESKRRERAEFLHGFAWIGSLLLDWLVGYGRRPWQAGIPCAFFITLGCILFSSEKMELQDPEQRKKPPIERRVYNRFWYSLGLFLPFVNLQTAELWRPQKEYAFLRNYVRVHILLGWVLIPILLAAISGLIK